MQQYLDLVKLVMENGVRKPTRTGVDTISYFAAFYRVDLSEGFPLLTTKKMHWKSLLHEVLWYLSGEDHIRNLRQHTKIWDAWADEEGNLETAYGYYWRKFPSAQKNKEGQWEVHEVDQIKYVIDQLKKNPLADGLWLQPGNPVTQPPANFLHVIIHLHLMFPTESLTVILLRDQET